MLVPDIFRHRLERRREWQRERWRWRRLVRAKTDWPLRGVWRRPPRFEGARVRVNHASRSAVSPDSDALQRAALECRQPQLSSLPAFSYQGNTVATGIRRRRIHTPL